MEDAIKKELEELKEASLSGRAEDEYEYGIHLMMFTEDRDEAFKYLSSAAEKGLNDAIYSVGLYFENQGDIKKAKEYYDKLIDKGSAYGYRAYGDLYYFGEIGEENKAKAKEFYEKGTDPLLTEHYVCLFELGRMYRRGDGVKENFDKAVYYFSLAEKEFDDPEISLCLGEAYLLGKGGKEKDLEVALDYLFEFSLDVSGDEDDEDLIEDFTELIAQADDEFKERLFQRIEEAENEE